MNTNETTEEFFYVNRGDEELGSFSIRDLKESVDNGDIHSDDYVYVNDESKWYTVEEFQNFDIYSNREGVEKAPMKVAKKVAKKKLSLPKAKLLTAKKAKAAKRDAPKGKKTSVVRTSKKLKDDKNDKKNETEVNRHKPLSFNQGIVIIVLLFAGLGHPVFSWLLPDKKWEYMVSVSPGGYSPDELRSMLQSRGSEGWELIEIEFRQVAGIELTRYIFKRPY